MKKKSKIVSLILVLVVVIGLGAYIYKTGAEANVDFATKSTASELYREETKPDKSELSFTGEVRTSDVYDVKSLVNGRVFEIYVKEGQNVKKGDKLLLIDNRDEIKAAKKDWDDSVASISKLKEISDLAAAELKRETPLFEKKEIDAETYKKSIDVVNDANAELELSLENSDRARIKYDVAVKNSILTAPSDGTVKNLYIFKRQQVSKNGKICEIADTDIRYVEITVDARIARDMYVTEAMTIRVGEDEYTGSIMDMMESVDDRNVYVVKVIIDAPNGIEEGAAAVVRFMDEAYTRVNVD